LCLVTIEIWPPNTNLPCAPLRRKPCSSLAKPRFFRPSPDASACIACPPARGKAPARTHGRRAAYGVNHGTSTIVVLLKAPRLMFPPFPPFFFPLGRSLCFLLPKIWRWHGSLGKATGESRNGVRGNRKRLMGMSSFPQVQVRKNASRLRLIPSAWRASESDRDHWQPHAGILERTWKTNHLDIANYLNMVTGLGFKVFPLTGFETLGPRNQPHRAGSEPPN